MRCFFNTFPVYLGIPVLLLSAPLDVPGELPAPPRLLEAG